MKALADHFKVPWRVTDALLVFALAWIGLPILIIILIGQLAPVMPAAHAFLVNLQNSDIYASFDLTLIDALAAMALVWYYLRKYGVNWSAVGWRSFSPLKALGLLAIMFLVFLLLVAGLFALLTFLVPAFNANQSQTNDFTGTAAQTHHSLALLALVIIPPIIEETVFRGFIFPAFTKRIGVVWGAIATSILFGIAHLQTNVSIYTFILSLILCLMYYRLKSIFPGMALHMLNNYLAYLSITGGLK